MRECCALLSNVFMQEGVPDRWSWRLDHSEVCSIKIAYSALTNEVEAEESPMTNFIWNKAVPLKVEIFAWRLLNDRIPTKNNLAQGGILSANNSLCVFGYGGVDVAHFLVRCGMKR